MKNKNRFIELSLCGAFLCCLFLTGCPFDPEKMIPKTPNQICSYMNENFEGDFVLIKSETEDTETTKGTVAYMSCTLFPGKTVITEHSYNETIFGWSSSFTTNYYPVKFENELKNFADAKIKEWFGSFEYKSAKISQPGFCSVETSYKTADEYISSKPAVRYNVVINAQDPAVKEAIKIKADSVAYDLKKAQDLWYWIEIFLDESEGFALLTETDINQLTSDDSRFYKEL